MMQSKKIIVWRSVGAWFLITLPSVLSSCAPAHTQDVNQSATKAEVRTETKPEVKTYTNPVLDADRPDPDIIADKGGFYMLHTMGGVPAWPLYRSPDMIHWTFVKHLLEPTNKPAWIKDSLWAPEVHRVGDKYVLTFTARSNETDRLCIGMAVSDTIDGTYKVQDAPIVSDTVATIDSHIFQDDDGRKYLLWKRDGETTQGRFGSIRLRELTADALAFKPSSIARVLLASDKTSQSWERDLVEAPWMLKRDGWYYLVYSGGFIGPEMSYRVGVARSKTLDKPFLRYDKNPILGNNKVWGGPGHGAFARDKNGDYWHLYHARHVDNPNDPGGNPPGKGRVQLLDKLKFVDGWPVFENNSPSTTPQTAPVVK